MPTIQEEAGLNPEQYQVIDRAPITPGQNPGAPPPNPTGNYLTASISGVLQHDSQLINTQYGTPRIPSTPLVPLSASGQASNNSAAQSTIRSVAQQVVDETVTENAISLQTNGTNNSVQTTLNLTSGGGGITVTPGSMGMVSIAESVFVASGTGHAPGAVPDPGGSSGTTRFLREDATFAVPGSGITLETNSTPNSNQSILNLISGSNITLTPGGSGQVQITATNGPTLETNSTPNSTQSTLNLTAGANVTLTAGAGGLVTIAAATVSGVPIRIDTYKALGSTVSVSATTLTVIDSIAVTMPSSGGPWRAFVSYSYYKNGGVNYHSFIQDSSSNGWSGTDYVTEDNLTSLQGGGFSPVTYANSATVTFYTKIYDTGSSTIETTSRVYSGSLAVSYMQVSIIASN